MLEFPNLNMKGKTKGILAVVKWQHRANGLFYFYFCSKKKCTLYLTGVFSLGSIFESNVLYLFFCRILNGDNTEWHYAAKYPFMSWDFSYIYIAVDLYTFHSTWAELLLSFSWWSKIEAKAIYKMQDSPAWNKNKVVV